MTTSTDALDATASLFSVLAHPGRLGVLHTLYVEECMSVSELTERLGVEQSAMSHQLRILRDARLVIAERDGRHSRYRLADAHVARIVEDAMAHVTEVIPETVPR
ncbi:MAG: transcriptional regulator [Deltaproteobacteria bacterium]|nr:MAG: transcriptional regulator [Deltaproteobacteria bacterium]